MPTWLLAIPCVVRRASQVAAEAAPETESQPAVETAEEQPVQEQSTSKGSSSRIEAKGATVHTFRSNDSPDAASSSREDQRKSALAYL